MPQAPLLIDLILVGVMAVSMGYEVRLFGALASGAARGGTSLSRSFVYGYMIAYQWALVACIVVLWASAHRPWRDLRLGAPAHGWAFLVCLVLAALFGAFTLGQRAAVLRRPAVWQAVRRQLERAHVADIVPHTHQEYGLWIPTAVTAGCCEEILFRGYLLAFVTGVTGPALAVAITVALFGLFHVYEGWQGTLKTAAFGLVATLIVLWSGSLIPAILIHATVDLATGDLGYQIFVRTGETAPAMA